MQILNFKDLDEAFFNKIEYNDNQSVKDIIEDVKANKDEALRKYTNQFDKIDLEEFQVSFEQIENAYKNVDKKTQEAIKKSIENVEEFAKKQLKSIKNLNTKIDNNQLGHKIIPIEKVGCYIPGGNYPLLSSAIMTVVPARVAGVEEIIACSPKIKNEVIVACDMAGADKIFSIGGAQAISAMAYGTQSVPKVNKIVGPGNKYVTMAKKYVYGECGIDFLAGPSEVMIIADSSANPKFVACDMLAQCEHDLDARAYLICFELHFALKVQAEANKILDKISTREIAEKSFQKSFAIIIDNLDAAIDLANKKAPEHLEICFKNYKKHLDKFKNYGSLFIGEYSAEVFGDYCSGTNHTLPTNEVAKYSGGLSVFDFIKIQTFQKITKQGAKILAKKASLLAEKEGLSAHKMASDLRNFT